MRDTYASQGSAGQGSDDRTTGEWVVIRRRKGPHAQEPVETGADDPVPSEEKLKAAGARAAKAVLADRIDFATEVVTVEAEDPAPVEAPARREMALAGAQAPLILENPRSQNLPEPVSAAPDYPVAAIDPPIDYWKTLQRVPMGAQIAGKRARRSSPSLIEYFRADPIAKGFDLLRTRLVRSIRAQGWRRIAVVSPTQGCGATFTAVNLALSLSRVPGSRTVLMDMNQRTPGVAEALGLRSITSVDQFLAAEIGLQDYLKRPVPTLAVGMSDQPCDYAAEVLHDPLSAEVLDDMIETLDPDLVLYDLPPILEYDDLAAFLPQVDGVLLVVDGTKTLPAHISACERLLEGQSQLLGVVLNRGRAST